MQRDGYGYVKGEVVKLLLHEAMILIVRDKCDPQAVHQAFLGLEEYAHGLPDEMLPKELLRKRHEDEE